MKRLLAIVLIGIATVLAIPIFPVNAAVNDFSISAYDIEYELSKDDDGRSLLKTTETIVAEFPETDQNRGIEREIPTTYDGHTVGLTIESVTKADGSDWSYTTRDENGVKILRIGDADTYVHGTQYYRISYTQHDVTRYFNDSGNDEWYWDTNGVGWDVPINTLTVRVTLDESIENALVGAPYCYQGVDRSTNQCTIEQSSEGIFSVVGTNVQPRENITVAFGFREGTFTPYQPTLFEHLLQIWVALLAITGVLGLIAFIVLVVAYVRRRNRSNELGTIPAEYIPPKNTSVFVSAQVVTPRGSVFGAQLIDLAVRHVVSIIETKAAKWWSLTQYDIKMEVDGSTQLPEIQEILTDMWGHLPVAGERISLSSLRYNTKYAQRTDDNDEKLTQLIEGEYAIREKSPEAARFFGRWALTFLIIGVLTLSIPLLIFAGILAIMRTTIRPLTDKGLELRCYLLGFEKYIKAAEAERLKFLQGPDTAEKVGEPVNVNDTGHIIKLYERALPYAILFGHEKKWTKQLGQYYETAQNSPSWYSGSTAFNAVLFANAMSNFSHTAAYSGGASASTGGSTGGGSSGGGGGGGGGGGW